MSSVGQFDDASDDEDEEITGVIKEMRAAPAGDDENDNNNRNNYNGNNGDDNDDDDEIEIVRTVPAMGSTAINVGNPFFAQEGLARQQHLQQQQQQIAIDMARREAVALDIIAARQRQQQTQAAAEAQVYRQRQVERHVQADQWVRQQRAAAQLLPLSTATVASGLPTTAASADGGSRRLILGGDFSANSKSSVRSSSISNSTSVVSSPSKPKKKRGRPKKLPLAQQEISGEGNRESDEDEEKKKLALTHRLLLGRRTNDDDTKEEGNIFNKKLPAFTKKGRGRPPKVSKSSDAGGEVPTARKKRGRPPKQVSEYPNSNTAGEEVPMKKKRGRPRKQQQQQQQQLLRSNSNKQENPKKKFSILEPPLEGPVMLASQLVGDELRNGLWPSPLNTADDGNDEGNEDDNILISAQQISHEIHMNTVAEALDSFARDVILHSMQKSVAGHATVAATVEPKRDLGNEKAVFSDGGNSHHTTTTGSNNQASRRDSRHQSRDAIKNCCSSKPFVGTLIALREVMTQNSLTIFGETCLSEAVAGESTSGSAHPNSSNSNLNNDRQEELEHSAKLIATSVIVAVIERYMAEFGDSGGIESALDLFFKLANAYDEAHPEFASHLQLERDYRGILPNGHYMNEEEDIARSVSFNMAVKRHPLIVLNEEKKLFGKKKRKLFRLPESNACHVAYVKDTEESS